jgi:hypothetical protein
MASHAASWRGAARSVTGSRHLLQANGARILLDCGLFQGRREEAVPRNRYLGFDPREVQGEERQSFSLACAIRLEHPGLEVIVPEPNAIHEI